MVGQNSTMNVVVTNLGLGSATGQLTATMSIPNGVTASSGTSNGWNLVVMGAGEFSIDLSLEDLTEGSYLVHIEKDGLRIGSAQKLMVVK